LTVETGLLLAEGALLLLLYLFIYSVVRSSSRQLKNAQPSVAAPVSPALATDTDPHLAMIAPAAPLPAEPAPVLNVAELAPAPKPAPPPEPEPLTVEATPADGEPQAARRRARARSGFNLSDNVRPRLIVARSPSLASGTEIPLDGGVTIGRSRGSELPISDAYVSHTHARVFRRGQYFFIEDLGSSNGTFLNGTRIIREAQLKVLDEVRMGETVLRYEE
jgi:FHA domain-containing protein